MGLTAWFGPRGVFSSGEAAHIFGSGSVPCRETPKNALPKKSQEKKMSDGGWVGLGFSKCTGGSVDFFLPAPRALRPAQGALSAEEKQTKKRKV
jgi:hypothetical protein